MAYSNVLIYKRQTWRMVVFYALLLGTCAVFVYIEHWQWKAIGIAAAAAGIFCLPVLIGWNVRRIAINLDTRILHMESRALFYSRVFEFPLKEVEVSISGRYISYYFRSVKLVFYHHKQRALSLSNGFSGWTRHTLREVYNKINELQAQETA